LEERENVYDLIICGGGLAGLSLARQIRLNNSEMSILTLERVRRPLPEAAFKVGESTIETGAFYYAQTLGLEDYLLREQLEKLGLRYFYQSQSKDLASRSEYGVARFLPAKSYQLDRGALENHLRGLVEDAGVALKEGVKVIDIRLSSDGQLHEVVYEDGDREVTARSRWVVDALGRRRFLQRKLGLAKPSPGCFNASWWRVRGKLDVNSFVPKSNSEWHDRVVDDRWQSTNHLMGKGYWVWLIPLAPNNTSVGIVASEELQPFAEYNTYERALEWLRRNEPLVADALKDFELMDFKTLKNYSYTSKQVFSVDRWACVGEAAAFADPYYSVGSNMIAFANGTVLRLMELDSKGQLSQGYVDHCNRYFLTLNDALTDTIHRAYPFLSNGPVMAMKTIWDYYIGWTTTDPQLYHEVWLDVKLSQVFSGLISRVIVTQARMMELFEEWARHETHYTFKFVDYIVDQPTLTGLHVKNLPPKTSDVRRIINNVREAADRIEELAHVIFFLALRDVHPEKLERFGESQWINTTAISLDPDRWESDGLFEPKSSPREFRALEEEMCILFTYKLDGSAVEPLSYRFSHAGA
jgi:flavin-dependent dehydrogenase